MTTLDEVYFLVRVASWHEKELEDYIQERIDDALAEQYEEAFKEGFEEGKAEGREEMYIEAVKAIKDIR